MDSSRTIPADVSPVEALAGIVAEGVIVLDGRAHIATLNAAAQTMLGYTTASLRGVPLESILHSSNEGDPLAARSAVTFADTLGTPVNVQTRRTGGAIVFASARRVDEIEQLKNELVSTVSHELKTPLAAIKAYAATLRAHPEIDSTHREEFLGVIEEQADRLSRVVDDMLLITRVDTEHLLRRRSLLRVMQIVDHALLAISYNPAMHPIICEAGDADISGDPERLRDIFRNLIENAIKYSPNGGRIVITASQDSTGTTVEVQDGGIGIAPENIPYIFDRFFRIETPAVPEVGGSGLGLYIVQALVRAHGGTIEARSAPGQGTTFVMKFPLR